MLLSTNARPWMVALALLGGCTCADDGAERLSDNVGASFADCNASRIKFLAAKHNVQLAFAPCGNNGFRDRTWSPDGMRLAFDLVLSAYVMNADAPGRNTMALPVPRSLGPVVWMSPTRLVLPVGPDADTAPPVRLAIVDLPRPTAEEPAPPPSALTFTAVRGAASAEGFVVDDLFAAEGPDAVVLVGRPSAEGARDAWRVDVGTGEATRAFPWLDPGFDTLTWTPSAEAVLVGRGAQVTHHTPDGGVVRTWDDAVRGVMSPDGTALALEHLGPETSVYGQQTWGESSDEARRRNEARMEAFEAGLPEHFRGKVRPPMISLVDPARGERFTITAFMGDQFAWYPAVEGWGTFFLWGFEGSQVKRNVALVDLRPHLEAVREGRGRFGMEPYAVVQAGSRTTEAP